MPEENVETGAATSVISGATAAQAATQSTPAASVTTEAAAQPANTPWYSSINDADIRGWVETKNFKDVDTALKSYHELEKFANKDPSRFIEVPKDFTDEKQVAEYYNKLGRPQDISGYEFPQDADKTFTESMAKAMHESGVSKTAAKKMIDTFVQYANEQGVKQQENTSIKTQAELNELKQEWGMAYDNNVKRVDTAANVLGLSADDVKAMSSNMGLKKTLNFLNNVYNRIGEPALVGAVENKFFSPEGARAKQDALLADEKFMEAWTDEYHPGHKEAVNKFNSLGEMILNARAK